MEITIKLTAKEIADLVLGLQSRQNKDGSMLKTIKEAMYESFYSTNCDTDGVKQD